MANIFKRSGFGTGGSGGSGNVQDPVSNIGALPLVGNTIDDLRYVISEETFFRWTGTEWVPQTAVANKFVQVFTTASWTSSSGEYWLEYDPSIHLKGANPVVIVLEDNSGEYYTVLVTIEITNVGIVRVRVPQSPDLRFDGKIIIA